ncbi:MAG: hypothetical protein LAT84_11940 [Balneolia bacterium]|nr:hypothetical protein [Balneolia bacterium]
MEITQMKYDDMIPLLEEFESFCEETYDLKIDGFGNFYDLVGEILEVVGKYKKHIKSDPTNDIRFQIIKGFGLVDIIRKILRVREHSDIQELKGHIQLLAHDTKIIQNFYSESTDSDSNKLFELYVAASCMVFAESIELDDPFESSGGTNPDIIVEFEGNRWGIACKVLHSPKFATYRDNVLKAIDQIEKSEVDYGFPILSMKNVINYDHFWPLIGKDKEDDELIIGAYSTIDMPIRIFNDYNHQYYENLGYFFGGEEEVEKIFSDKKSFPMSMNLFPGICGILDYEGNPVPTFIRRLYSITYLEFDSENDTFKKFINSFDRAISDL